MNLYIVTLIYVEKVFDGVNTRLIIRRVEAEDKYSALKDLEKEMNKKFPKFNLHIHSVEEYGGKTTDDIRNKTSPLLHLISMIEEGNEKEIQKVLPLCKKSINYLTEKEVYDENDTIQNYI